MAEVKKLVIDRSKWLQGEGFTVSTLLRPSDGKMCCLGFYCEALGVPRMELAHRALPIELSAAQIRILPSWLFVAGGDIDPLTETNDDQKITHAERETDIAELFLRNAVEVEFVGNYPETTNEVKEEGK